MGRLVTPPKRVTSPTWGPPPSCKQALKGTQLLSIPPRSLSSAQAPAQYSVKLEISKKQFTVYGHLATKKSTRHHIITLQ